MSLSFRTVPSGEDTVLEVGGEIDLDTRDQVRDAVGALLTEGHRRLVLDLSGVSFIDSSGLGVLLGVRRSAEEQGGSVRLVVTNAHVLKVFEITNLDAVFSMHRSREDALAAGTPAPSEA